MLTNKKPTVLDLFSGIGGFSLGFESEGFETIGFSEICPNASNVLKENFPNVPNFKDIRNIYRYANEYPDCECCEEKWCARHEKHFSDCECIGCQQWEEEYEYPDVITAGVPCQPASLVGERRGADDERWLWPETIRVISVLRPRFAVFENPAAILTLDGGRAFNGIVSELVGLGYNLWWELLPAYSVGAGHRRERIYMVASNADSEGLERYARNDKNIGTPKQIKDQQGRRISQTDLRTRKIEGERWYLQSDIIPVVHGLPSGVVKSSVQCVGNSIVPQIAQIIARSIRLAMENKSTKL